MSSAVLLIFASIWPISTKGAQRNSILHFQLRPVRRRDFGANNDAHHQREYPNRSLSLDRANAVRLPHSRFRSARASTREWAIALQVVWG
jgi:hypothetical protein